MSARDDDLEERLEAFLARRTPPARFASNARALAEETRDLLAVVLRLAPHDGSHLAWWAGIERHLLETSQTRAWPTVFELKAADKAASTQAPARSAGSPARSAGEIRTPVEIDEGRILRREAVTEHRLWGRGAEEILERGHVTLADLEPYREHMRRGWRSLYGAEEAARLERERVTGLPQLAGDFDPSPTRYGARRMPGADRSPDWTPEGEPAPAPTAEQIARRPYTDEERRRIRLLAEWEGRAPTPPPPQEAPA